MINPHAANLVKNPKRTAVAPSGSAIERSLVTNRKNGDLLILLFFKCLHLSIKISILLQVSVQELTKTKAQENYRNISTFVTELTTTICFKKTPTHLDFKNII